MTEAERRVYEATRIPVAIYSYRDGKVITDLVSDGYCEMVGMERERITSLLDSSMFGRVHPDDAGRLASIGQQFALKQSGYDVLYRTRLKGSKEYSFLHTVGRWQKMEDGTEGAVLVYTDVSESISVIENLNIEYDRLQKDLYFYDNIADVPNVNYLYQFADEKISSIQAEQHTPAILYFDVRTMASYNIEYGYAKGDELLRLVADTIKEEFPDALVCRGESDHFIVIDSYDECVGEKLLLVDNRIKRTAYGKTPGIQCAIVRLQPGQKAVEGVDRARTTMKEIGDDLNVVYREYSNSDDDEYWIGRYIIQNFEDALQNGWIKVFYQPIFRTETEKVTILEGLARWIDPVEGMISPGQFIPVLSRYHLLHKLDLFMVEQVCREFQERKDANLPIIPVSVNFSAQDFDYVDVVEELNRTLEKYGIENRYIIVEITEQDLAKATDHFKEQLLKIHQNGYRLWIDDFGTGYSSLNVFGQYHVDRIKFDMDLVRHLDDNNGANRVIMKHIVKMCREIGVHTLAEGVETKEQLCFLRDIDCEMVQGFYFRKPESLEMTKFKVQQTGLPTPIETMEERSELCDLWLAREK